MNFKSLLDKIIDKGKLVLTQPTMLWIDKEDIGIMKKHTVEPDEAGRIDLISLMYYESERYIDYLLKFNGISDPLSINEGDVIIVPTLGPNYKKLERPTQPVDNIVRQEFLSGKRLTPKDKRRTDFLKKKYKIKEVLPPNVLKSGFKTFKFTEKNGEKATEMGMGASTPNSTYTPSKGSSSNSKSLGNVSNNSWKKVDGNILNKKMENLTLSDVSKLQKAGLSLDKFEDAQKARIADAAKKGKDLNNGEAFGNIDSTSSKDLFDSNGSYIGKESTVKTTSVDSGKKTTTVTITTVKPDGSSETKQTQTFEAANGDETPTTNSTINAPTQPGSAATDNSSANDSTESGLENKIKENKKGKNPENPEEYGGIR